MKTLSSIVVICIALLCSASMKATGMMYATPLNTTVQPSMIHPQSMIVSTTIQDQIASTTVREQFFQNLSDSVTLEYGFPLPASASASGVRLWLDSIEYVLQISTAPVDTTHSSGGGGTVQKSALQTFFTSIGYTQTAFRLPIAEKIHHNCVVTIELNYIELLPYTLGLSAFNFPLRSLQYNRFILDTAHTKDFSLHVTVATGMKLDTAWCSSHPQAHVVKEANNVGLIFNLGGSTSAYTIVNTDFVLQFRVAQTDIRSAFFSNKPSAEDGHFVFLLRPSISTDATSVLSKTFTFVIDVSGSMQGTKIKQAKEAAAYCVSNLNPQDRFNVIAFSSSVGRFQPAPVSASVDNIQSALTFINALNASGGTALQDAALAGLAQYNDPSTVNIIIFLTDGLADLDQSLVQRTNTKHVRICVFGIGSDVNSQQLSQLASLNNGLAEFIKEAEQTVTVISTFYNKIRNPVWRNLTMSVSPTEVYDVLPVQMPDMNVGEQVTIAGRYKQPGDAVITIHAFADGKTIDAQFPVRFSADSTTDVFSPKIWARQRIAYLQTLMAKETPNSARWTEWKAEIIRLGLRYGIVTEFTTYKDTGTVSEVENDVLASSSDNSAFPIPFNAQTTISFRVYEPSPIRITVYDLQGREITQLLNEFRTDGNYSIQWDGRDNLGQTLASGVYLCSIRIGDHEQLIRLTIVR